MNTWVVVAVLTLTVLAAAVAAVQMVRDQPIGDRTFAVLALAEAAVLVQLVLGLVLLVGTENDVDAVLFVGYLVGLLVALPIGAFWSLAERSRAGTGVVLLAALTVVALEVRLVDIWAAGV
ncbi:hypothetical protein [Nocardioides sp. AX2bis]|uniref:hypothetical protein n=1 Tax=Nocardioides sp. AX2bis TaxID=2653157 RepID=UPI0012EF8C4A|nr:hypothetical protein [Nocardioides sp. AX2bis]VXB50404.1 conserved membrane hypothetical protein [Nocardioides sp. AX2bis]